MLKLAMPVLRIVAIAAVFALVPFQLGSGDAPIGPTEVCAEGADCVRSAGSVCFEGDKAIYDFRQRIRETTE